MHSTLSEPALQLGLGQVLRNAETMPTQFLSPVSGSCWGLVAGGALGTCLRSVMSKDRALDGHALVGPGALAQRRCSAPSAVRSGFGHP